MNQQLTPTQRLERALSNQAAAPAKYSELAAVAQQLVAELNAKTKECESLKEGVQYWQRDAEISGLRSAQLDVVQKQLDDACAVIACKDIDLMDEDEAAGMRPDLTHGSASYHQVIGGVDRRLGSAVSHRQIHEFKC